MIDRLRFEQARAPWSSSPTVAAAGGRRKAHCLLGRQRRPLDRRDEQCRPMGRLPSVCRHQFPAAWALPAMDRRQPLLRPAPDADDRDPALQVRQPPACLKRQRYGRAKLDLMRIRVLHPSRASTVVMGSENLNSGTLLNQIRLGAKIPQGGEQSHGCLSCLCFGARAARRLRGGV
jgi:hypothetical protein